MSIPQNSSRTVFFTSVGFPCGKVYSGEQRKVEKLLSMHKKICTICKEAKPIGFRTHCGESELASRHIKDSRNFVGSLVAPPPSPRMSNGLPHDEIRYQEEKSFYDFWKN